jgi:hypothetical protein
MPIPSHSQTPVRAIIRELITHISIFLKTIPIGYSLNEPGGLLRPLREKLKLYPNALLEEEA